MTGDSFYRKSKRIGGSNVTVSKSGPSVSVGPKGLKVSSRGRLSLSKSVVVGLGVTGEASARIPPLYRSCAALNVRYPDGLGKTTARDKTAGVPVRNFFKSNRFYALAMSYNRGLDRDHDGIACEKQ